MCDGCGPAKGMGIGTKLDAGAMVNPRYRDLTEIEVEDIASFVHEANRMYQGRHGEDPSPPWNQAPEWQRESAKNGVRAALEKGGLNKLYHHGDADDPRAREQHDSWLEEKLRQGWRYGEVKDPKAKTHPCCLPFHALPSWQRRKDVLFRALCEALDPRREV
jgi:hypothetical protein